MLLTKTKQNKKTDQKQISTINDTQMYLLRSVWLRPIRF